jgi:hypothetical protein
MSLFDRIKESIRVRKELEEAAKAIANSRAETGSEESDNDDVHDGMEDLLYEVYDEAGLDAESDCDDHDYHAW